MASRAAGALVALAGASTLAGWILDIPLLRSTLPGLVAMKPNTGVSLIFAGVAIALLSPSARSAESTWAARAASAAVLVIAGVSFTEYLVGDLGIDQVLFREPSDAVATEFPGRMALTTAIVLVLMSAGWLVLSVRSRPLPRVVEMLAIAGGLIALVSVLAYAYDEQWLFGLASQTPMALNTAVALVIAAGATVAGVPDGHIVSGLTRRDAGGTLVRRLLAPLFLAPLALGWIAFTAARAGIVPNDYAMTILVIFLAVALAASVLVAGRLTSREWAVQRDLAVAQETWSQVEKFFNLSIDLIGIADTKGRFLRLSPSWSETLGWTREQLLARPFIEFVHPDDRAATMAEADKISKGARVLHFTNRYECADGTYRVLEWHSGPDETGRLSYFAARDVTEALRAQRALSEKAALVELSHDAIVVLDPEDTRIRSWNVGAAEMYGFGPAEAVGRVPSELLSSTLPAPLEAILAAVHETGQWEGEITHRTKAGKPVIVDSRWALQRDEKGKPMAILETNRDVTARVQAEAALRASYSLLEERVRERTAELEAFTYTVSHDLRTPIRAMIGFVDVLVEDSGPRLDAAALDSIAEIRGSAVRLGRLVDDLLAFSRLGRHELKRVTSDMQRIAQEALETILNGGVDGCAEVSIEPMPAAAVDPALMQQVYANLLANAIKFSSHVPDASVEAGADVTDGRIVYFVRDNGVGFDMAYADQLFGVFQRLHPTSEFEGNGIGLAAVKRVVTRHGGRVWADSAPNHGATFYFTVGETNEHAR